MSSEVTSHCAAMSIQYDKSHLSYLWLCCLGVHASLVDSSGLIFVYHALELFLLHFWSIYIVSSTYDLPDSTSMHLYDLVGPFPITNTLGCILSHPQQVVDLDGCWIICGQWEVVWMAQVCCSSCTGTACVDLPDM